MKMLMHQLPPFSGQEYGSGFHEGMTCMEMPHVQSCALSAERTIIVLQQVTLSACLQEAPTYAA